MSIFSELKVRSDTGKIYFTIDDLQKLPIFSETPIMEIINGDLYLPPSPNIIHHDISVKISELLRKYLNSEAKVFNAPVDLILSKEDVVVPDIFVVRKENSQIIGENNIQGAPDIVIEILSTNKNHDLIDKKDLYEQHLIPEYIIIDNDNKKLYHFILMDNSYNLTMYFEKDSFQFNNTPELILHLNEIFI